MIEKTFIVVCIEVAIDGVLLYLKPLDLLSESTILSPVPRSEDAQIAREMVGAVMQEVKKAFPEAPMTALVPPPSPFVMRLYLTQKEYEELHKPTVNDEINIQLDKKEGE